MTGTGNGGDNIDSPDADRSLRPLSGRVVALPDYEELKAGEKYDLKGRKRVEK